MQAEVVHAISVYQEQHQERLRTNKGYGEIKLSAIANQPDSILIQLINAGVFGSEIHTLEDLNDIIEEQQRLNDLDKDRERLARYLASKTDALTEIFNSELPNAPVDVRRYTFFKLTIEWETEKSEDGSWFASLRLFTPFHEKGLGQRLLWKVPLGKSRLDSNSSSD